MSLPRVITILPGSPADRAGLSIDDELLVLNGEIPRDVIQYQVLVDEPLLDIEIRRSGISFDIQIEKDPGEPLGVEVHSALFDQVRTCDNHCEFCFIYQLPPKMRDSLYVKDDDYRLSFLFGNFTTLTRFTESDLERVVSEGLSPLNVSIHATDPEIRSEMLRNRRGGMSLRWLRALLDRGIEVHGQIVVCPGVNDGLVLEDSLCTVLEQYSELESICVVPLGVSKHHSESRLREHTIAEANQVIDVVEGWQRTFLHQVSRRLVHAADEYYLMAGRSLPNLADYEGCAMYEDGVGIVRTFEAEFRGTVETLRDPNRGFFTWADVAAPNQYRAPRLESENRVTAVAFPPKPNASVAILTAPYAAQVLEPLVAELGRSDIRIIEVPNQYFGGNIAVAGLMVGEDIRRVLEFEPEGDRYLLPDVCLSSGVFLDGTAPKDLPRVVEVVPTDGDALRKALAAVGSE